MIGLSHKVSAEEDTTNRCKSACEDNHKRKDNVRLKILLEIAEEKNYVVTDLWNASLSVPKELRREDGVHYTEQGSSILAQVVAERIKEQL